LEVEVRKLLTSLETLGGRGRKTSGGGRSEIFSDSTPGARSPPAQYSYHGQYVCLKVSPNQVMSSTPKMLSKYYSLVFKDIRSRQEHFLLDIDLNFHLFEVRIGLKGVSSEN